LANDLDHSIKIFEREWDFKEMKKMKIEMTVEEFKKIFGDQQLTHKEFVEIAREKINHGKRGRPRKQ